MQRTQISLPAEELKRGKARATVLGISLAEYFRRLLTQDLAADGPPVDVSMIFDLGDSGGSDITRFKDEYIGEAVEAEYERKMGR